jgi:hypothetical protein
MTIRTEATSPEVTNHFSPLRTQPPLSEGTAVASMRLGSEPALRSVTA